MANVTDDLVDDFGIRIGSLMGWPPMAGRMAGVLMLSDRPMTLTGLRERLGASKGSASEITRLLISSGTVERVREPGRREHMYRWRHDAWVGCLTHQLTASADFLAFAEEAYDRSHALDGAQRRRIGEMRDFYAFMTANLTEMLTAFTRDEGSPHRENEKTPA